MANQISLTQNNLDELLDAFDHYFPANTVYSADTPFSSISGEYNWYNRRTFIEYIKNLTGVGISDENGKIITSNVKLAQTKLTELVPKTGAKETPVEANTPDKELREQQEVERAKRETELRETQEKAQRDVQASIKRKQEIFERNREIQRKQEAWAKLQQQKNQPVISKENQGSVLNELKGKVAYAVPTSIAPAITLSENEAKFVEIAKNDPEVFSQKLATLIVEKNPDIPPETLNPLSRIVAVESTNALVNPLDKPIPTGVFASLTGTSGVVGGLSETTQSEIAKTTSVLTAFSENQNELYRVILTRSIGENLTNKILGFPQEGFVLSLDPQEGAFSINLSELQENSFALQESPMFLSLNSPVITTAQSVANSELKDLAFSKLKTFEGKGFLGSAAKITNSQAFDSIAPFLGVETKFSYIGTNYFGKAVAEFFPEYAPLMANVAGKLGIDVGISTVAKGTAKTADAILAKGAVGKAVGSAATKVATKLGLTAAGQAAGSTVPIIGNIIAFLGTEIIGKIAEKIPWKKIKEWSAAIVGGVAALIVLPFLGIGQAIGVGLGAAGISAAFGGGLGGLTLSGIGSGIASFFGAVFSATLGAVWAPIIATLIGFPLVVVLILFIINSGAYVVPPSSSLNTTSAENRFIEVTKEAEPSGPFDNSDLPLKIKYKVTINAKSGNLTYIEVEDNCKIITENGTTDCPSESLPNVPDVIPPNEPYTYEYSVTYSGNNYKDSFVINTFTAKAQTANNDMQESSATTSIKIGNPPETCPSGWPVTGTWVITQTSGGSFSHKNVEAMDIATPIGTPVISTSTGIVNVVYTSGAYAPVYVDITSSCSGKPTTVRYAHLSVVSVQSGQQVTFGQIIGLTGNGGTGPHLHYEFRGGIIMKPPYIPKDVPRGCSKDSWQGGCGTTN